MKLARLKLLACIVILIETSFALDLQHCMTPNSLKSQHAEIETYRSDCRSYLFTDKIT